MIQLDPYKKRFLKAVVPHNEALNQAQMQGCDIFRYDPKGKGATAYAELTKEILKYGN